MSKYRPEKIELNSPTEFAEKIEAMLRDKLHKRAGLARVDEDGDTTFSFYPTKGEYLLVFVGMIGISKEIKEELEAQS